MRLYDRNGIAVVEWANKHPEVLREDKTSVEINVVNELTRRVHVSAPEELIQVLLEQWSK